MAAIVNVKVTNTTDNKIGVYIPHDIIASKKFIDERISVCDFVGFAGYPDWHDKKNNAAIFRVGTIASDPTTNYTYDEIAQGDCILYEAFSFAGSSGSPVFRFTKPIESSSKFLSLEIQPALIGVNAGFLPIDAIKDQEGTKENMKLPKEYRHSGLSYFYKSSIILELID